MSNKDEKQKTIKNKQKQSLEMVTYSWIDSSMQLAARLFTVLKWTEIPVIVQTVESPVFK